MEWKFLSIPKEKKINMSDLSLSLLKASRKCGFRITYWTEHNLQNTSVLDNIDVHEMVLNWIDFAEKEAGVQFEANVREAFIQEAVGRYAVPWPAAFMFQGATSPARAILNMAVDKIHEAEILFFEADSNSSKKPTPEQIQKLIIEIDCLLQSAQKLPCSPDERGSLKVYDVELHERINKLTFLSPPKKIFHNWLNRLLNSLFGLSAS